ncbi:FtsH-binding integral membrane protein [Rhizobium sp. SG741]|nr:FtsH-binding integral membrane protein [Rhizobium sp. SG741]
MSREPPSVRHPLWRTIGMSVSACSAYAESDPDEALSKKALMRALTLDLDFINLFMMLLRFTGQRRA